MQIWSSKKKATKCLKTWIWEGLGLHLGKVWEGLGRLLDALERFFNVFPQFFSIFGASSFELCFDAFCFRFFGDFGLPFGPLGNLWVRF